MSRSKIFAARGVAAALAAVALPALSAAPAAPPAISAAASALHLEMESGTLAGVDTATTRAGYSGSGYVTGFDASTDNVALSFQAKSGLYEMRLRYACEFGDKGYTAVLNGLSLSGMLTGSANWATASAGKVLLRQGTNTLAMDSGWGYYDLDAVDFVPATIPALAKPPKTLVDAQATPEARKLISKLIGKYGQMTLSGQQATDDLAHIKTVTGQTPAIQGGDMMDYSPSRVAFGATGNNMSENMIQAWQQGSVVTMVWHWNAPTHLLNTTAEPWWRGFYTEATTFDLAAALANPGGEDYQDLLRDIDAIAVQLQKFSDNKVPVLWRPLHEAEGGWFWWGAKGSAPFKTLWRLMYDRLVNVHGLHNLIWVYSANTNTNFDWYPGDDVVDVVGLDGYPASYLDPMAADWDHLYNRFNGKKLIAMTEFGKVPDVPTMRRMGERWSYFVSWSGDYGPAQVPDDYLRNIYTSTKVGNLGALGQLGNGGGGGGGGGSCGTASNGYPYCCNGAASDPDGDGWGWENNQSCVVSPGSCGVAPNGYGYCCQGSATDPDGDGWGWENGKSCVVRIPSSQTAGSLRALLTTGAPAAVR